MFNAVLGYILELELNASDAPERYIFDIKKNVNYAIGQVGIEVRIPILTILFFLNLTWFILTLLFFWVPHKLLYQKYRTIIKRVPIVSSVLALYETIIFMIYFES